MEYIDRIRQKHRWSALSRSLLITAVYAFVGYAWIIGSEIVLSSIHSESPEVFMISILKGLGYVTASAILIFILIFTNLKKVIREIKERNVSDDALKEAQKIAHIGSFSFDSSTRSFECSEEAARIIDMEERHLSSDFDVLFRYVHGKDRERVRKIVLETLKIGGDASFDCHILQVNAPERTIHVRIHSEMHPENNRPYLMGTLQDITDRMQAESTAREFEAIYKALLNSSYDLVYLKDSSLRYIAVNSNMQRYYGIPEEDLIGKMIGEIKPGMNAQLWEARDRSVLISGKPIYIDETDGNNTFETIIFPVDMSDNKRGVGGISRDITDRRKTEAEVERQRDLAQSYFDVASVLFIVLDQNGFVLLINQAGCDILHLPKESVIGQNWIERFIPDYDRNEVSNLLNDIRESLFSEQNTHENDILIADGTIRRIEWRNTILKDSDGFFSGILSAGVDVTELRQTLQALRESERSKSVLLSNLPGMAYRCAFDKDWTMQFVSNGCFELTGYLPNELIDNACITFNEIICPEYRNPIWNESVEHMIKHMNNRYEYEILTASGERKWVLDINQGLYDESEQIVALEGIIIDITQSKLQFLQIQYLNNHDQLTGLHNRLYYDQAKRRLDIERYLPMSIILVDINGLKLINDAFGNSAGDKMIQTTGSLLKTGIRTQDILARIGGDEFAILMPNTDSNACIARMTALKDAFNAYNAAIKDKALVISLSIGCSTKTNDEIDFSHVEKDAEANMARRKLLDQKSHHNAVLSSIMATLFERSFETEEHAVRIGELCTVIGERLHLSHDDIDKLRLFAILHDIGKIGISDQILNKPSRLSEEEMTIMRMHPEIGYRIAMASPDFASIADLILTHQERWDGNGYPNHLAGEKIPLLSRILAVADAYDAMTKDRVYRKAMSRDDAIREIRVNAGTQFDPNIANLFLEILEQSNL